MARYAQAVGSGPEVSRSASAPWNETNPEWWRMNARHRAKVGGWPLVWRWLANEWAALKELEAVDAAAQRYVEHAGADGEDADDVCFADLLIALAKRADAR